MCLRLSVCLAVRYVSLTCRQTLKTLNRPAKWANVSTKMLSNHNVIIQWSRERMFNVISMNCQFIEKAINKRHFFSTRANTNWELYEFCAEKNVINYLMKALEIGDEEKKALNTHETRSQRVRKNRIRGKEVKIRKKCADNEINRNINDFTVNGIERAMPFATHHFVVSFANFVHDIWRASIDSWRYFHCDNITFIDIIATKYEAVSVSRFQCIQRKVSKAIFSLLNRYLLLSLSSLFSLSINTSRDYSIAVSTSVSVRCIRLVDTHAACLRRKPH